MIWGISLTVMTLIGCVSGHYYGAYHKLVNCEIDAWGEVYSVVNYYGFQPSNECWVPMFQLTPGTVNLMLRAKTPSHLCRDGHTTDGVHCQSGHDKCQYEVLVKANNHGYKQWVAIGVGLHPSNSNRFAQYFWFERYGDNTFYVSGHGIKKPKLKEITSSDYPYEYKDPETQQVLFKVEARDDYGWRVSGDCWQWFEIPDTDHRAWDEFHIYYNTFGIGTGSCLTGCDNL